MFYEKTNHYFVHESPFRLVFLTKFAMTNLRPTTLNVTNEKSAPVAALLMTKHWEKYANSIGLLHFRKCSHKEPFLM